jgi:hypothetical protein
VSTATETRPSRPLQPHGTPARAYGRADSGIPPCTCTPCVEALRRQHRERQTLRQLGYPGKVSAAAAVHHLNLLVEAGMTQSQIVKATGISQGSLGRLRKPGGEKAVILASTQARVLAVPVPSVGQRSPGEARVDGTGTRRRLRALARAGWSSPFLSEHTPVSRDELRRLLRWERVTVGNRARVVVLYELLKDVPGPSRKARERAASKGWWLPSAWDGLDMDDPAVSPASVTAPAVVRPLVVAEDAEFIRRTTGVGDDLVAERLGISVKSLQKNLQRARAVRPASDLEVAA